MSPKRRAYLFFGRTISPLAVFGLKVYSQLTQRPRVRVVVENEVGEILLLRNVLSNGEKWMLPGGGVGRKETLVDAAQRELLEETGINKPSVSFRYVGTIHAMESGLKFDAPIYLVAARKKDLPKKLHNPREIVDVMWCKIDEPPASKSLLVKRFQEIKNNQK